MQWNPKHEYRCGDCWDYNGVRCCDIQRDDGRTVHHPYDKPCTRGVRTGDDGEWFIKEDGSKVRSDGLLDKNP
jgi:hypothetical protein